MIKEEVPQGWKRWLDEWRYKYDTDKKQSLSYQSTINYNKYNGLSLFNIVGESECSIEDEHLLKRALIARLRKVIDIGKHIMIISQQKYKGKDSYCIIVQLHCILKQLPSDEQLISIRKILTDYSINN